MLTIKHVVGGTEKLVEVESTSHDTSKHVLTGHRKPEAGGDITISSGRAFVMNENGKTVGIYNFN